MDDYPAEIFRQLSIGANPNNTAEQRLSNLQRVMTDGKGNYNAKVAAAWTIVALCQDENTPKNVKNEALAFVIGSGKQNADIGAAAEQAKTLLKRKQQYADYATL